MNKLLLKMLLLALPFAGFLGWFEVARGGRENNSYLLKRNRLLAAADHVEVLVLGSSHEHDGVLPGLMGSNVFNLAAVSQSYYFDAMLLDRYADTLPHLKLVLWPVSYFSLQSELADGGEPWRGYFYQRYHGIWQPDYRLRLEARNYSAWYLYGRQSGFDAVRGVQPRDVSGDYDALGGRTTADAMWSRTWDARHLEDSARVALERHHAMLKPKRAREQEERLVASIRWLQSRGVRVILFQSPLTPWYREGRRPDIMKVNRDILERLTAATQVTLVDLSEDARFGVEDFLDGDHLNFKGAQKFSEILRREVIEAALPAR